MSFSNVLLGLISIQSENRGQLSLVEPLERCKGGGGNNVERLQLTSQVKNCTWTSTCSDSEIASASLNIDVFL
jgi:hypothetical protein